MHFHFLLQSKLIFLLEVFSISILIFPATETQTNTQSLFYKYEEKKQYKEAYNYTILRSEKCDLLTQNRRRHFSMC